MTRIRLAILAFALALSPAPALAALLPVNAEMQLVMRNYPDPIYGLPSLVYPIATGTGLGSSNGGGVATIPAGIFAGNPALVVPISPTYLGLTSLTAPANSLGNPAGSFAPNGAMGLAGAVFFRSDGAPAGTIPLFPIGGGGRQGYQIGPIVLTMTGVTWMGGTQVFTAMKGFFGLPYTVVATSYDNRTAGGAGTIQLVAPVGSTSGLFGSPPLFGILTLTYTPEPGTLTLLGAGVAALAALGRRKQRAARRS